MKWPRTCTIIVSLQVSDFPQSYIALLMNDLTSLDAVSILSLGGGMYYVPAAGASNTCLCSTVYYNMMSVRRNRRVG